MCVSNGCLSISELSTWPCGNRPSSPKPVSVTLFGSGYTHARRHTHTQIYIYIYIYTYILAVGLSRPCQGEVVPTPCAAGVGLVFHQHFYHTLLRIQSPVSASGGDLKPSASRRDRDTPTWAMAGLGVL